MRCPHSGTEPPGLSGGSGGISGPEAPTAGRVPVFEAGGDLAESPVTISGAGAVSGVTLLDVDNLRLDGNSIFTTDANGPLTLAPNGTGPVLVPFGTRAAPGLAFTTAATRGIYGANGGIHFSLGSNNVFGVDPNSAGGVGAALLRSDAVLGWSAGSPDSNGPDVGIRRESAGVQLDTNGSTGLGKRLTGRVVEASTAGVGSPNLLAVTESRKALTNEGATAEAYHTLPLAAAGIEFVFVCQDADGIRITANAGDTIRLEGTVSLAAGFVRSSAVGSCLILLAVNSTEWVAISITGTWTVDL